MKHIKAVNHNKYNCAGCSACQVGCPTNSIQMLADDEGFLYPMVDEQKCSQCGLCIRICPWMKENPVAIDNSSKVYAVKHKSEKIRENSTSGGAFTAIAEYVISLGGVVFAASFDKETKRVEHVCVTSSSDLGKLRGSKYVQSYLGDTFIKVKEYLIADNYVLFVGTPCQCDGLKSFLQKDYQRLFAVDILCHGVPSPLILSDTLSFYGGEVQDIKFRDKELGWRKSYHFQIFKNNEVITNDTFLNLYFRGVLSRRSCYKCRYMTTNRVTDITIGDYWNISETIPEFEDRLGVSCVLVNSDRGEELFKGCVRMLDCKTTGLEQAIQGCMQRYNKEPKIREQFWEDYHKYSYEQCIQKYGYYSCWEKIKGHTYRQLKKLLHKLF